jgi:hypothetical protein
MAGVCTTPAATLPLREGGLAMGRPAGVDTEHESGAVGEAL